MLKGRITKNDGEWVYILTENQEPVIAKRVDIDFGVLVGDSVFIDSQSGRLIFHRIEEDDALDDNSPHFFDERWQEREVEYKESVTDHYDTVTKMYEEKTQAAWEGLDKHNEEIKKEGVSTINVFFVLLLLSSVLGVLIAIL